MGKSVRGRYKLIDAPSDLNLHFSAYTAAEVRLSANWRHTKLALKKPVPVFVPAATHFDILHSGILYLL